MLDFIGATILAGLLGGLVWIVFIGIFGFSIKPFEKKLREIDSFLNKTLKIPSAILMIFYYIGFCYLFVKFTHLLIIIYESF